MSMKIISGGQTGADRAALEAAKDVGIETGGHAPKNYLTENGSDYTLKNFGLKDSGLNYVGRTELNASEADITIWFGNEDIRGFFATKRSCVKYNKEIFDCTDISPESIYNIIKKFNVVNIAGNRESMNKTINSLVYDKMRKALEMYNERS